MISEYSLDSLESVEKDSLEKSASVNDENNSDTCNLRAIKSAEEFIEDDTFDLDPTLTTLSQMRGTKDVE